MFEARSAAGSLVHKPCGPRKSGRPLSVEMPAPVSTVTRSASSTKRAAAATAASETPSEIIVAAASKAPSEIIVAG